MFFLASVNEHVEFYSLGKKEEQFRERKGGGRRVAMWHTRSAMLWGSVACPLLARCRTCRGGAAPPPADEAAPPAGVVTPPLTAGPPRL